MTTAAETPVFTVVVTVIVTTCPGAMLPMVNVTIGGAITNAPVSVVAETMVNSGGIGSTTTTFVAGLGPGFVAVRVKITVWPMIAAPLDETFKMNGSSSARFGVVVGVTVGVTVAVGVTEIVAVVVGVEVIILVGVGVVV